MRTRKIVNGTFVLACLFALMAMQPHAVAGPEGQQVQPSIKIRRAMTLNDAIWPQRGFNLWQPIVFGIEYEITGVADTWYQVKGFTKVNGWVGTVSQSRRPGIYRMFTGRLIPGNLPPGEMLVQYAAKLGEGGTLLDEDTAMSVFAVLSPDPNLGYLNFVQKDPDDGSVLDGGGTGFLRYTRQGPALFFHFDGYGLSPGDSYTLIYLPEPWPHQGLICLGSGTADEVNHVQIVGAKQIPGGLPVEAHDLNAPQGALFVLVRTDDVDCDGQMMMDWKPEDYLFGASLVTYVEGSRRRVYDQQRRMRHSGR